MVTDPLTDRIGSVLILSVEWSVSIDTMINFDSDGDRDDDDTCKRTFKGINAPSVKRQHQIQTQAKVCMCGRFGGENVVIQ